MTHDQRGWQRQLTMVGIWLTLGASLSVAAASETPSVRRQTSRSAHFLLHTDLAPDSAADLLERMEKTLSQASDYWRRPVRGLIECYIVEDLKRWPHDTLPHPMARLVIDRIGGVTLINDAGAGIHTHKKVIVIATSRLGVAEHEVVHAYCGLVFGRTGPAWYREGIAQTFAYAQEGKQGLQCPPELIADLTGKHPKPICQVVDVSEFSNRLYGSIARKLDRHQNLAGLIPISDWSESDVQELDNLKKQYAWSWLACHMLQNNPNYQTRFKSLGQGYLAEQRDRFDELFRPIMNQLSFEYNFTVQHFSPGFRVDLCYWDWEKSFRCISSGRSVRVRVDAARGYQATGLIVSNEYKYQVSTSGFWKTDPQQPATDAAGTSHGRGGLDGIVLKNYRLSRPFPMTADGQFQPRSSGQLYLRCHDDWSQLQDNEGSVVVTLRRAKR